MGALPISVVVPAYNRAELLPRALASIFSQSPMGPAEVIVVDDGSSDGSAGVAVRAGAKVVRHETNLGTAIARNTGFEAATQDWVALLDSDDEWLPGHLASLWAARGDHLLIADSALRCGARPGDDTLQGPAADAPQTLVDPGTLLFPANIIAASAAMVRRDVVEDVGGFQHPDGLEDMDLWVRVLERGTAVVLPTVGVVYHVHEEQTSKGVDGMEHGHLLVARRYAGRPWWSERIVERWAAHARWNRVRSALRRRRFREALDHAGWVVSRPQRVFGAARVSLLGIRLRIRAVRLGSERRRIRSMVGLDPRGDA